MSKSSFLNNKKLDKSDIAIVCILLMFGGFLVSRLFLSLGMILFGINALWNVNPKRWLQQKYWLLGCAWVAMYGLSWFWSEDKETWGVMFQLKLPVLLLPLSFAFTPRFSARQLQMLTICIATMLTAGAVYSLSFLVFNYAHYLKEYNVSHIIPTPVYNEYISFSACISIFIAWCVFLWPRLDSAKVKWLLGAAMVFLAVYIHILASKSGLVDFYLFIVSWTIYIVVSRRSLLGIAFLVAIPFIFIAAVKYIPTLHERKVHVVYSWYVFKSGDKTGKLGDLSRLFSYDISTKLIAEHPVVGVGTGDMLSEMKTGYTRWYPQVTEVTNKLIPHNQFLTVALGCGIPCAVVFALWVFFPLSRLKRNRESFFFFAIWMILLFHLMIEPYLEGQFGVFLYVFFLLLFWHNLPQVDRDIQKGIRSDKN